MSMLTRFITGVAGVGIVSAGAFALDMTTRDETGAIIQEGELGVFSFKIGDCINGIPEGDEFVLEKATGVPCSQPHQIEVYAETFIQDSSETIPDNFISDGDEYCYSEFNRFVGLDYEESKLNYIVLHPTPESWTNGDREITCLITDPAGDVTGTLQASQR
jgi:hypothetical protein